MPTTQATSNRPGPRVTALLASLRAQLVRGVWLHGVGTAALAAGAWLLFAYAADRLLHLPRPIRVFHGAVLVALPLWFLRRELFAALRRVPGVDGLALLVERRVPQSADRIVSAVQLAPSAGDPVRGSLVQRVLAEAEDVAGAVDLGRVVDPTGPRRRAFAGVAAGVVATVALAAQPAMGSIFLQRMVGADVAWPRRTSLSLEIPTAGGRLQVADHGDEIVVRAARGTDLPVFVHAEGVLPDTVQLHFASGAVQELRSTGRSPFRTLLRSVQEDTSFHVTGGDDRRGVPVVRVEVLQPPDLAGLAFVVDPPDYSGLPRATSREPEVEVLAGSRVTVHVRPDPADATGVARTFPDGDEIALVDAPFPLERAADAGEDAPAAVEGLAFETVADASLRFRVHLVDASGLPNPDPALLGIEVVPDRRPELVTLAPGRAEVPVVAGGAVPLRVRLADDYGLSSARWTVRDAIGDTLRADGELPLDRDVPLDPLAGGGARHLAIARARLEVDDLGGADGQLEGTTLVLQVAVHDNRAPEPNETLSAPVRLRVVDADEFLRRLQDGLARAGADAERLSRLSEESGRHLREVAASASGDGAEPPTPTAWTSLANETRRVQGDARALARDLGALAEGFLYARLDPRANELLDRLDAELASAVDRGFDEGAWVLVGDELEAGRLGRPELGGDLVTLVDLSLAIARERAGALLEALEAARSSDGAALAAALTEASRRQEALQLAIEDLVVKLGEWDNFQSVLTLTRDILGRQRNLAERTRIEASRGSEVAPGGSADDESGDGNDDERR